MLNTKLNLYNAEWLDVVFSQRNKAYGAYNLRQHYAGNMVRAMLITFTVIAAAGVYLKLHAKVVEPVDRGIVVTIEPIKTPPKMDTKPEQPKEAKAETQPAVATKKFLMPKPTSKPVTEEAPRNVDLVGQTGQVDKAGEPGAPVDMVEAKPSGPPTEAPAVNSTEIYNTGTLEVQPEPYGGMGAFSKFLSKTLRYPAAASEAGVSGRVIVSFVIEKNGELSNIMVERGVGFGLDQEALRVLKLAKAWKPGVQNGQPVRVRYMIPISFQLPE